MIKLHQAIIIINSFSRGIMIPVLNLILLEKGSNLQTLPLLLAVYAVTVLIFELPSGICADLYGRKTVFLISCFFNLISFVLLIIACNYVWLVLSIVFFGLGRAFSSGSLDALFIDQAIERHGEVCLAKVTSRMAILEAAGLAIGGLAGGIISDITGTYLSNILVRIVLTITVLIFCFFLVKEQLVHENQHRISLIEHFRKGSEVIFSKPGFSYIFLGVLFVGFFLFTIETYWQPAFMDLPGVKVSTWMLGLITFIGFLAVTSGNAVIQKLLDRFEKHWWLIYMMIRIIFSSSIIIFSFQKGSVGYIAWYAGIYLFLGMSDVTENAIINKYTPNGLRASILSLISLVSQIGVLSASIFSSLVILKLNFSGIWITVGSLLAIWAAVGTTALSKKKKDAKIGLEKIDYTEAG